MNKYLVLIDNTQIPIDDISQHATVICYPENMAQFAEWWDKLTPDTINHQIYKSPDGDITYDIINDSTLHFNKIELEHCSTGLLMRIVFASSLEEEFSRLMEEKEEYRHAYEILLNGETDIQTEGETI